MTPEEIKRIRMELKITQQQFANLLKISRMQYSQYENGSVSIPIERGAMAYSALNAYKVAK